LCARGHPLISIVIPARNEPYRRLAATIRSIIAGHSTSHHLEIVVVDDASTDACGDLADEFPGVAIRIVRLDERIGVARARNHGVFAARGEILFMTDSHVSFGGRWDEYVLENIGPDRIIAATIVDPTSAFRGHGCSLLVPTMGTKWNREAPHGVAPVQIASCAGTVLERSLFERVGGYDSGMILYGGAEPEFSVRCWLSGAEIVSVPQLTVHHRFKSRPERQRHIEELRTWMVHNSMRFGLLYLDELASLEMLRYLSLKYPHDASAALKLLAGSDVWPRRDFLESTLRHSFDCFVDRFSLKNEAGQEIFRR
jgi:glycosyltransferase involved in cell wall biosynthesis